MKKSIFFSFLFVFVAVLNIKAQNKNVTGNLKVQLISPKIFKAQSHKIHPVALKAIKKGTKPGKFKNVKVEYQPNVVFLQPRIKKQLENKMGALPILPIKDLKNTNINPGKIYIDPKSDLVFEPVKVGKDTVALTQPPIEKVFKDIKIPLQRVNLNVANTSYTLEGTTVEEETDNSEYTMRLQFNDTLYHFEKEIKTKNSKTKINFDIHLDGFIGLTQPYIEASYSKNDGYRMVFNAKEKLDIKVLSDLKLDSEFSFPIWGYTIPVEDFGSCEIGIFMVVEANGEVHLEAGLMQGLQVKAGVEGDTYFYYPQSIKPVMDFQKSFDVNYKVSGKIKAFAGVDVKADLKYKSYDILQLRTRGGVEFKAEIKENDITNFDAEVGAKFLIDGKLKLKTYKKKFELYSKYYLIWKKQEKNTAGYIFTINDADAYFDRVWGTVYTRQNSDTIPFEGNIKLKVLHPNGQSTLYAGKTNKEGVFAMTNIDLKKGDKVMIKTNNSPSWSDAFEAQIPFKEIHLSYADYYTNTVFGSVSGQINYFPQTTQNQQVQHQNHSVGLDVNPIKNIEVNKNLFVPKIKISKQMFEQAITYKGNVEIISEPLAKTIDKKIISPAINIQTNNSNKKNKKRDKKFFKVDKKIPKLNITETQSRKVTNLPFGMFKVTNIDIKPGEKVKAKINIDGFVLESDFIVSDGLIFTPSIDVNKQGGILSPTIKADDSYVVINAFRNKKSPVGKVHLIKGIDMKHTSPHRDFPNQKIDIPKLREFKQAVHPLVFYNKTVGLKPMSGKPGFSIAHTGAWQVKNIYYDRKYLFSLTPIDGHRFEYIGYTYDGKWVGYKYYQKTCKMEKSKWLKATNPEIKNIFNGNTINPGKYQGKIGH